MSHYFTVGHAIRVCDETTGHVVRDVAFFDCAERAKIFSNRCNSHDELLAALQAVLDEDDCLEYADMVRSAIQKATT